MMFWEGCRYLLHLFEGWAGLYPSFVSHLRLSAAPRQAWVLLHRGDIAHGALRDASDSKESCHKAILFTGAERRKGFASAAVGQGSFTRLDELRRLYPHARPSLLESNRAAIYVTVP